MEFVCCPVCGANEPEPAHQLHDWLHGLGGPFSMVRCRSCRMLYLTPRPDQDELASYYPEDYAAYSREAPASGPWWRRRLLGYGITKRCRAVASLAQGGRLLDVGCATGEFAARMRRWGDWTVEGLELGSHAAALAQERYGLAVHVGAVDHVDLARASFDVITLWDVLEHLPHPPASLDRMIGWLRPGGWLVIRTPDSGSIYGRLWGRYWAGLDAPRHMVVFDHAGLLDLLRRKGLAVSNLAMRSGSHAVTVLSLRFMVRDRGLSLRWSRALGHPLAQVLTSPLFWLLDRLGGPWSVVAARKPASVERQTHPGPGER
ncbi:MAG: class I SAM-dependent methyltransferase [Chloroflexota bacterium]